MLPYACAGARHRHRGLAGKGRVNSGGTLGRASPWSSGDGDGHGQAFEGDANIPFRALPITIWHLYPDPPAPPLACMHRNAHFPANTGHTPRRERHYIAVYVRLQLLCLREYVSGKHAWMLWLTGGVLCYMLQAEPKRSILRTKYPGICHGSMSDDHICFIKSMWNPSGARGAQSPQLMISLMCIRE